jgi:hypothetical protein
MFAKFDYFDRLEQPTLVLCNPNDVELATIQNIDEFNLSVNFNAVSELSLTISKEPANPAYDLILLKRQILVKDVRTIGVEYSSEDLGYFIITDFNEIDGENGKAKTITATSCEIELNNLEVPYIPQSAVVDDETIEFAGTYYLYNASLQYRSLLHIIMPAAPAWTYNVPTSSLATLQRTFDENLDGTLYNFLMNKLAETYECIVEFDILNRIISFIPKQSALTQTSVFLSRSNFLDEVSLKESGSEYANCISVSGGDEEVSIGRVNPLGNGLLFDFSYDISQGLLSDELVAGLGLWKSKFEEQEPLYILAQRAYIDALEALTVASTAKDDTMIVLRSAEESKRIADFGNSESLKTTANNNLATAQGNYNAAVIVYNAAVITLNNKISDITNIQNLVQFDAFLTPDQPVELSRIVKMATYKDEFIIVTDGMTNDEKLDEMVILYDKTKRLLQGGVLEGICEPRREITVNCESFAFSQAFKHYGAQLQTGCLIDIEQPNDEITSYILQKIGINYSEKTMDLTFGNRYRISNPSSVFGDLYGNTSSMASIVASNYIQWGANIARVNELEIEREAAIQLNAQRVINSTNQRQEFSPSGSYFLSTNPLDMEPSGHGISIADGTMMFFTDYVKDEEGDITYNGKMAIGRTINGNGVEDYGIIGGNIVAGTVTADKIVAGSVSKGTNLIYDGSFEGVDTYASTLCSWQGTIGSSLIESTGGFDNYQFFRGTSSNIASINYIYQKSAYAIAVNENSSYYASFYYRFPTTNTTNGSTVIKMSVYWYNSSSSLISTTYIYSVDETNVWLRKHGLLTSPVGAVSAVVYMNADYFTGTVDFDGVMLEQTAILNDYSPHIGEFVSRYTVINDEGIKVLNGKIQILNDANDVVFGADDDGNLEITGKITAESGDIGGFIIAEKSIYSELSATPFTRGGLQKNQGSASNPAFFAGSMSSNPDNCTATGVISAFSLHSTGKVTATSAGHGFPSGTTSNVSITSAHYSGIYTITYIDANRFYFPATYSVSETGTWARDPSFYVNYNGFLHAENANIVGNITATTLTATSGGSLAGWTFGANGIMYKGISTGEYVFFNTYTSPTKTEKALAIGGTDDTHGYYGTDAPFYVNYDGALHTSNLTATGGTISGWTIGDSEITSGTSGMYATMKKYVSSSSDVAFGVWDTSGHWNFYVNHGGDLYASNATITGATVTGTLTTGSVLNNGVQIGSSSGGLTVNNGRIYKDANNYIGTTGKVVTQDALITGGSITIPSSVGTIKLDPDYGIVVEDTSQNPDRKLEIYNDGGNIRFLGNDSGVMYIGNNRNSYGVPQAGFSMGYDSVDARYEITYFGTLVQGSKEEYKKNISKYNGLALSAINNSVLYEYSMENDGDKAKRIGLIVERESPKEVLTSNGVDIYSMISFSWKAIQELSEENDKLLKRIESLEKKK